MPVNDQPPLGLVQTNALTKAGIAVRRTTSQAGLNKKANGHKDFRDLIDESWQSHHKKLR
jgi:hypothetical protein